MTEFIYESNKDIICDDSDVNVKVMTHENHEWVHVHSYLHELKLNVPNFFFIHFFFAATVSHFGFKRNTGKTTR